MIVLWLFSFGVAAAAYWITRRAPLRRRLTVVGLVLIVPLAFTIYVVWLGDRAPHDAALVVPAPKRTP
jgi:peptidoglycan/LPS O-acetylase OafA/YrhL